MLLGTSGKSPAAVMREEMASRPARRGEGSELPPSITPASQVGDETAAAAGAASVTGGSREQAAAELSALRATARAAQEQLGQARRRIAALEKDLAQTGSKGEGRSRHEFDLTADDWRKLAADGKIKYRLPCTGGAASAPSDEVLDELGLAPDDRDVLRQAFEHSLERQRDALLPLCATALGDRMHRARERHGPCHGRFMPARAGSESSRNS